MNKKKINLLITCAGGEMSPQLYQLIKEKSKYNIRIIAVDANESPVGRYFADISEIIPLPSSGNYLDKIKYLIEEYEVDLLLPGSDEESLELSKHKKELNESYPDCFISVCDYRTTQIINNKIKTFEILQENNINVPEWMVAFSKDELKGMLLEMLKRFECVVIKPSDTRGSRGVYIIHREGFNYRSYGREIELDINHFIENIIENIVEFPYLVMQGLLRPVYDMDILSWHGEALKVVPRKRLDSENPNSGHQVNNSTKLQVLGERIAELFNLSVLLDCDVMFDEKLDPYVIEINSRISGSLSISLMVGENLVDDLICLSQGHCVEKQLINCTDTVIPYKKLAMI